MNSASDESGSQGRNRPTSANGRPGTPHEQALWLHEHGFWPTVIHPGKKRPIGDAWGLERLTVGQIEEKFAWKPDGGCGITLGPGRAPGGKKWLIDIEGDGGLAETSLTILFEGEVVATRGWASRRGCHWLFTADGERLLKLLVRAGAKEGVGHERGVFKGIDALPDLEFRIGGYKEDETVLQVQSVVPPTVGDDGKPRVWNGTEEIIDLPESAYRVLERIGDAVDQTPEDAREVRGAPRPTKILAPVTGIGSHDIPDQGVRVGDDFNRRADWRDIIREWRWVHRSGEVDYVCRPGKDGPEWSATIGHCKSKEGIPRLFVFTTNATLPVGSYSKLYAYARLEHGGDMKKAIRALAERGYGTWIDNDGTEKQNPPPPGWKRAGRPSADGKAEHGIAGAEAALDAELARRPLTDMGNGERLVARHGNVIRYCHPWSKWLPWDGRRWVIDQSGCVRRLAKASVRRIYSEACTLADDDKRKALIAWGLKSESRDRVSAMMDMASVEPGIPILTDEMDRDGWLLNCANGTVDLHTGGLREHRQEDMITQLCPVEFDPDATCPLWDETLELFFAGDRKLIAYWQRLCGYSLVGVIRDHILPVAYGTGSNGKSTILGTLLEILGDYAMKCPPDMLMARQADTHPTDRTDLFRKRLVVAIETESGRRLNETMVKELTGGDRIRARRMREDFWEFSPTHTLVMATNHKPTVLGSDKGIWRRLRLIPFTVSVEDDKADKTMPERLRAEFKGILAWCVRGCLEWQQVGLNEPDVVKVATGEYRREQDRIRTFLGDETIEHVNGDVQASKLYARYRAWCEANGERSLSQTLFGESMHEAGIKREKRSSNFYLGIKLRD